MQSTRSTISCIQPHACTQAHALDTPIYKLANDTCFKATVHHFQTAQGFWMNRQRHQHLQLCHVENIQTAQSLDLGKFPIRLSSIHPAKKTPTPTPTLLYFIQQKKQRSDNNFTLRVLLCQQSQLHVSQFMTATAPRRIACRSPGEVGVCRSLNPIRWCTRRLRLTLPSDIFVRREIIQPTAHRVATSWITIYCAQVR